MSVGAGEGVYSALWLTQCEASQPRASWAAAAQQVLRSKLTLPGTKVVDPGLPVRVFETALEVPASGALHGQRPTELSQTPPISAQFTVLR